MDIPSLRWKERDGFQQMHEMTPVPSSTVNKAKGWEQQKRKVEDFWNFFFCVATLQVLVVGSGQNMMTENS